MGRGGRAGRFGEGKWRGRLRLELPVPVPIPDAALLNWEHADGVDLPLL